MSHLPRLKFEAFEARRDLLVAAMEHDALRPATVATSEKLTHAEMARDEEGQLNLALFNELFAAALESSDVAIRELAQRITSDRTMNANNAKRAEEAAQVALRDLIAQAMEVDELRSWAQAAAEAQTRLDDERDLERLTA